MADEQRPRRTAFVLGGGGVLGAHEVGMLRALSESEIVDHKVVDKQGKEFIQKIPGRLKWGDITLKRGITKSMDFWTWRKEVEDGKIQTARTNGSIIMYDREYNPAARWDVVRAWPSKLSGPTAKADSNEFGVEEVVIVFEAYKRVQ